MLFLRAWTFKEASFLILKSLDYNLLLLAELLKFPLLLYKEKVDILTWESYPWGCDMIKLFFIELVFKLVFNCNLSLLLFYFRKDFFKFDLDLLLRKVNSFLLLWQRLTLLSILFMEIFMTFTLFDKSFNGVLLFEEASEPKFTNLLLSNWTPFFNYLSKFFYMHYLLFSTKARLSETLYIWPIWFNSYSSCFWWYN